MLIRLLILIVAFGFMSGCARLQTAKHNDYRTVETSSTSDAGLAKSKHDIALQLIDQCQIGEAEQCLHESLLADVSYGPAHNTLGKIYFDQKKFYLAAWEFEYAMKTMPNRAEPVNNLGLVYESVEQIDQAVTVYQQAHEMDPENAEYLGNFIRARVRRNDHPSEFQTFIEALIFIDDRQPWVDWAKQLLVKAETQPNSEVDSIEYNELEVQPLEIDAPNYYEISNPEVETLINAPDATRSSR